VYTNSQGDDCTQCRGESKELKKCKECGQKVPLDRYNEHFFACNMCARNGNPICEECGIPISKEEVTGNEDMLCVACSDKGHGMRCQDCCKLVNGAKLTYKCGRFMCARCLLHRIMHCKECKEEVHNNDFNYDNGRCKRCDDSITEAIEYYGGQGKKRKVLEVPIHRKKHKTSDHSFFERSKF
jgi:hypothetical protein